MAAVRHFVYRLIPRHRAGSDPDIDEVMGEHLAYWAALFDAGRVVVAGPVAGHGEVWGLAVVQAEDEAELQRLAAADPAVRDGVADFEVLPMPSSLARPVEPARGRRAPGAVVRPRVPRGRPTNRS